MQPYTDAVRDLKGIAVGQIAARGTIREPKLAGALEIGGAQVGPRDHYTRQQQPRPQERRLTHLSHRYPAFSR
mgnify:CR=1 FL=1